MTCSIFFFFNDTATTEIYTLSLHDALPIWFPCCDSRNRIQVFIRSTDCLSVRSAEGTWCAVKNCCTSSLTSASQKRLVAFTIVEPLDMVIFFSTSGQWAFTHAQATGWFSRFPNSEAISDAASWFRTVSETLLSSTRSTSFGSRNRESAPPTA